LRISPLGAAIKGATSFSSQENSQFSCEKRYLFIEEMNRVQLVGELLLELLVRGSNPSGVGLLLESVVRGWNPTCPIRVHLSVVTGNIIAIKVCISIVT
jgi:hypothetical protein